jgi:hypothetical protein
MCECYHVDHPGADPDCEAHGTLAVSERERLEARVIELEAQVRDLTSVKVDRPKKVYCTLNYFSEVDRLTFIIHQEGLEAAIATAKSYIKLYLEASLKTRQKFNTRSYPYRFSYVEAAYSARYLLRTKYLENIDHV